MELTTDLKRDISALFDVFEEASGTQRVVTPLEYPGSGDRVVVRARPRNGHWVIDENGEAAMYARMSGGDLNSDSIKRWAENLAQTNRIELDKEEQLVTTVSDARLIAPTLFHVAAAAQQLFALATSAKERETSQFKEQVSNIVREVNLVGQTLFDAVNASIDDRAERLGFARGKEAIAQAQVLGRLGHRSAIHECKPTLATKVA